MKWLLNLLRFDAYLLIYQKTGFVHSIRKINARQFVEWIAVLIMEMTKGMEYSPMMVVSDIQNLVEEMQEIKNQNSFVENQALSEMLRSQHPIN